MTNPVLSREVTTPSEVAAERKRARLNAFGAWWKRWGFKYLVVANVAVMLMSGTHIVHGLMTPGDKSIVLPIGSSVTLRSVGRESGPTYSWTTERANGVWHLMLTATTWPTTIDYACRSADVIRWNGEASVTLANPINGGTLTDDCHAMQARGLTIACGSSNRILWTGSSIPSSSITGITGATP